MPSVMSLSIPRAGIDLAANLHVPDGFDDSTAHPALVIATPGSSVKEQIAANYARRLAERGYLVLAFDPAFQGEARAAGVVDSRGVSRSEEKEQPQPGVADHEQLMPGPSAAPTGPAVAVGR